MRKSFKKAIAILLAVLMIACSVPFTAFADAGDYEANVDLRFGTFFDFNTLCADGSDPTIWFGSTMEAAPDLTLTSLQGPAVDYDKKTGSLTLSAAKAAQYATDYEIPTPFDADYQLQPGDYFTVTTTATGISPIGVLQIALTFSDNIEPAGYYSYKGGRTGKVAQKGWGTAKEAADAMAANDAKYPSKPSSGLTWTVGGNTALTGTETPYSCGDLYGDQINFQDGAAMDDSTVATDADGVTYINSCSIQTEGGDVSKLVTSITDPNTGEMDYYSEGEAILETFLFKVTGEGPISFDVYDTDNTKLPGYTGGYCFKQGEGIRLQDYTTYAVNTSNNPTGAENPGSCKLTFMGTNVNKSTPAPTPSEYTINFVNAAGETVSTQTVAEGEMPTAPANTAADFDNDNHYAYAWPTVEAAAADATYTEVKTPTKHTLGAAETVTAPTCATAGLAKAACSGCAYVLESEIPVDADAHDWVLKTEKQDATCTEAGKEAVYECKNDATHTKGGETINPKGHTWVDKEVVAPTVKDAGYTLQECSVCQATQKINETEALGVKVTVEDATALGTVSGLAYGENKVAYGDTYTVTATALEGAKFTGWAINGKVVSSDPTYSAVAYSDVTVVPMFEEVGKETITVTFYDKYANVLAQFTGTPAEVQASIEAPAAPVYNGYTFKNWSIDESVFKAADKSMSIYAVYEANKDAAGYTVTVPADVTLTLPEGVENGSIPYNTTAVVTAEGAQAWKVGDAYVGYGDTYEFFVGSDIAIEPVFEAVATTDPTVTKVSVNLIEGSHKVAFLATRNVPDGYTLVSTGFVYGKALTDAELDLDKVNQTAASGGKIKVAYASVTGADQFALNYGLKSKVGTATAKAFIVVKSGDQTQVIYSERMEYTY